MLRPDMSPSAASTASGPKKALLGTALGLLLGQLCIEMDCSCTQVQVASALETCVGRILSCTSP